MQAAKTRTKAMVNLSPITNPIISLNIRHISSPKTNTVGIRLNTKAHSNNTLLLQGHTMAAHSIITPLHKVRTTVVHRVTVARRAVTVIRRIVVSQARIMGRVMDITHRRRLRSLGRGMVDRSMEDSRGMAVVGDAT